MRLLEGGKFALGITLGAVSTLAVIVYAPGCGDETSSLWFCGESQGVITASLDAIVRIIASIAWPTAIVILALLFQRNIIHLLSGITRLKAPWVEAEFANQVLEAEQSIKSSPNPIVQESREIPSRLLDYLKSSKSLAVISAWKDIEEKLAQLLSLETGKPITFVRPADINRLNLRPEILSAILDLKGARNVAAHTKDINLDDSTIYRYLELAVEIGHYLDGLLTGRKQEARNT